MGLGSGRTKEKAERTSRKTARKGRDNRSSMGLGSQGLRRPHLGFRMYGEMRAVKGAGRRKSKGQRKKGVGMDLENSLRKQMKRLLTEQRRVKQVAPGQSPASLCIRFGKGQLIRNNQTKQNKNIRRRDAFWWKLCD